MKISKEIYLVIFTALIAPIITGIILDGIKEKKTDSILKNIVSEYYIDKFPEKSMSSIQDSASYIILNIPDDTRDEIKKNYVTIRESSLAVKDKVEIIKSIESELPPLIGQFARVKRKFTELKREPSLSAISIIAIPKDTILMIEDEYSELLHVWYKIRYEEKIGWLKASDLILY